MKGTNFFIEEPGCRVPPGEFASASKPANVSIVMADCSAAQGNSSGQQNGCPHSARIK
ncbi:hypothetical protein ACR9GP_24770 [Enterobacter ludwigii]|jgi:hypothetical protein